MSRFVYRLALPAALVLLLLFGVRVHRYFHGSPPAGAEEVRLSIPEGAGFGDVCRQLRREGLLHDRGAFYLLGRLGGADRQIRAGTYRIMRGTPPGRVLRILQRGANEVVRVTVPEGRWLDETARIVAGRLFFDETAFLAAAREPSAADRYGVPGPTLEGYLFPETYLFFADETLDGVLRKMTARFREVFDDSSAARAAAIGLTPREAVTLASIIEAEAAVADERPRISAVFHNRLRIGMRLQADPTVQYARGSRERLLRKHLEIDSPYNTYVVAGLPPGPICSPGAEALHAALFPAEGSRDLYFVASGEGGRHIFTSRREDHDRAKLQVRRKSNSP